MVISDNSILSIVKTTCKDINTYYEEKRLPKFIKRFIAKSKYNKLMDNLRHFRESTALVNKDTFYSFLSELYDLDNFEKSKYSCNKITKYNGDITFIFYYKIDELSDDLLDYYANVYGKVYRVNDFFNITYDLISVNKNNGNSNSVSSYTEDTNELIDSMVFLNKNNKGKTTTVSYKTLYNQNYFARFILDSIFDYLDNHVRTSKRILED